MLKNELVPIYTLKSYPSLYLKLKEILRAKAWPLTPLMSQQTFNNGTCCKQKECYQNLNGSSPGRITRPGLDFKTQLRFSKQKVQKSLKSTFGLPLALLTQRCGFFL